MRYKYEGYCFNCNKAHERKSERYIGPLIITCDGCGNSVQLTCRSAT